MAFIFDYYGTEVYLRAVNTTHQEATTKQIMATMGIVMDVQPTEMPGGQKTCIQQQYSCCAKNRKNNILRVGGNKHHVRVNLEQGKAQRNNKNWKRPKEVFFNSRIDPKMPGEAMVEKVSTTCMWAMSGNCGVNAAQQMRLASIYLKVDYAMDDEWNRWVKVGIRKMIAPTTEQESNIVGQNYSSTYTSPTISPWHQSAPVRLDALDNHFQAEINTSIHSQVPRSWNLDLEHDLEKSGTDLLDQIGWDWNLDSQVTPRTSVSNGYIVSAGCGNHGSAD